MKITLEVEVERVTGPFRSKEAVAEELIALLDGESVEVEGTDYEVQGVHDVSS